MPSSVKRDPVVSKKTWYTGKRDLVMKAQSYTKTAVEGYPHTTLDTSK